MQGWDNSVIAADLAGLNSNLAPSGVQSNRSSATRNVLLDSMLASNGGLLLAPQLALPPPPSMPPPELPRSVGSQATLWPAADGPASPDSNSPTLGLGLGRGLGVAMTSTNMTTTNNAGAYTTGRQNGPSNDGDLDSAGRLMLLQSTVAGTGQAGRMLAPGLTGSPPIYLDRHQHQFMLSQSPNSLQQHFSPHPLHHNRLSMPPPAPEAKKERMGLQRT
ncbi:unnamed protein product [Protopolystoma xenopodis]|uniref:Uncharacterized protein n=1 Tax=Protopolystoma xenopodis TaxID=117903 RepID=A0A448X948_9PLAT|nr:unnamed protein product [Protopolystoma xenopodis]